MVPPSAGTSKESFISDLFRRLSAAHGEMSKCSRKARNKVPRVVLKANKGMSTFHRLKNDDKRCVFECFCWFLIVFAVPVLRISDHQDSLVTTTQQQRATVRQCSNWARLP